MTADHLSLFSFKLNAADLNFILRNSGSVHNDGNITDAFEKIKVGFLHFICDWYQTNQFSDQF